MGTSLFRALLVLLGAGFAIAFAAICGPPLLQNPDLLGAALAGFVIRFPRATRSTRASAGAC